MVRLTTDYIIKMVCRTSKSSKKSEEQSQLQKITHLSLPEKSIDSIADISSLKSVSVLYLQHNKLQNVENIEKNVRLTHLHLQYNKLSKMEHFNGLTQLKKLYLGYNCISVVEGLENINTLEELHVENQQLPSGETIYFDPRTIANLSQSLRVLDISNNNISTLYDLKDLCFIEKLNASKNALSDLTSLCSVIQGWPKIRDLDFRGNGVVSICKYRDKVIASTQALKNLDGKEINDVTRSFIRRFESIKEERREKMRKSNQEETPFSDEVTSIAEHLPPALRQSVSARVKKEFPRSKSLTLSLMQIPVHTTELLPEDPILSNAGLQPRPSRKISQAERVTQRRKKSESVHQTTLPHIDHTFTAD